MAVRGLQQRASGGGLRSRDKEPVSEVNEFVPHCLCRLRSKRATGLINSVNTPVAPVAPGSLVGKETRGSRFES